MFQPIKSQRLTDVIFDQILELIINQKIMPGEKLPSERDIAEQMECSRSAVREALRMLKDLGIVEITKGVHGGSFVKESNFDNVTKSMYLMYRLAHVDIKQLLESRKVIELATVGYAVERATDEEIARLRDNVDYLKNGYKDPYFRMKNNREFHFMFTEFSRNQILMMSLQALMSAIDYSLHELVKDEEAGHILWVSHDKIVKAMEKRDKDLAVKEMEEHLKSIERRAILHHK